MTIDPNSKLNLSLVSVLLLDSSQHGLEILAQILKGFGAQEVHRCLSVADAERIIKRSSIDLIIADPATRDGDGYELLKWLRSAPAERNRQVPMIVVSGHSTPTRVGKARDVGANFFVVKPVSPKTLLERILWINRDKRAFVEMDDGYCGPDRRFKFIGPPVGSDGRRNNDLTSALGDASEPNMSQSEIDTLVKPQRIAL